MKKLFLILVSVLVLGGCSVDDDTSVSGGGVSSGGDDMAITTYPNVVEASRTVVEGGYLVDYVYFYDSESSFVVGLLSLIDKIWEIFDKNLDKNSEYYLDDVLLCFKNNLISCEGWFSSSSIEVLKLNYFEKSSRGNYIEFGFVALANYFSSGYDSETGKYTAFKLPEVSLDVFKGSSSWSSVSDYFSDCEFLRGRFTIFEPAE